MKTCLLVLLLIIIARSEAQVNAYAKVISISSTTLAVNSVNETFGTFSAGSQVIIMQMQDDVIGTNTSDNSSFGNLSSIASAGDYEVTTIASVTRSGGVPVQITINSPLSKTFNLNNNSSVQVISYPLLGTNGYTTTSAINAVSWNGSVGGVVAIRVNGTLTLNHSIAADYAGFRGGTLNGGNAGACDASVYRTSLNDLNANKGEGIYKVANSIQAAGRGKIINGGGGGNSHNGGGGGGSNYTAGGEGGRGYGCSADAGGLGGVALNMFISPLKSFMGGGGGAGEANNSYNTGGGAGGGIVIINATSIATSGSGAAVRISANGESAASVGNDGAGGGGAGGSVLLAVQNWNVVSTKTLIISSDGGNGGSVTDATAHGGGGGGAQGAVIFNAAIPATNITTSTANGVGGRNYAGGTFAADGQGSSNQGIFFGSFALLAAKILEFKVVEVSDNLHFHWKVVNQQTARKINLEGSEDNLVFVSEGEFVPREQISGTERYSFTVPRSRAKKYYRLRLSGEINNEIYSHIIGIKEQKHIGFSAEVRPVLIRQSADIIINSYKHTQVRIDLINSLGTLVKTYSTNVDRGESRIELPGVQHLTSGYYSLTVSSEVERVMRRIVIAR